MTTHMCDSEYNTGQGLKQNSFSQSQSFKNCTCQLPYSTQHNEGSVTPSDGTPDVSAPTDTVAMDSKWFSKQDGCVETEEVTAAKPQ
jgi:hypothetical protein